MKRTAIMDDTRFEELAMAYGGTLARWPAEDRAAAEAHLAASPHAQTVLREAEMLDATLDLWDDPVPSTALTERVLADAATASAGAPVAQTAKATAPKRRLFSWLGGPRFAPAGMALAGCLALGFIVGTQTDPTIPALTETTASAQQETYDNLALLFGETESDGFLFGSETVL